MRKKVRPPAEFWTITPLAKGKVSKSHRSHTQSKAIQAGMDGAFPTPTHRWWWARESSSISQLLGVTLTLSVVWGKNQTLTRRPPPPPERIPGI